MKRGFTNWKVICLYFLLGKAMLFSQNVNDLKKSIPVWFSYDNSRNEGVLFWKNDPGATNYTLGEVKYLTTPTFSFLTNVAANVDSFVIPDFQFGKRYNYRLTKSTGAGFIDFGIEQPLIHQRGKCLILLDQRFEQTLDNEIARWVKDISGDGWIVDTLHINPTWTPPLVKSKILNWYTVGYQGSQSVILFGNIPVPYSGNTAIDGHPDHAGAWPADTYYAEMNGIWTDNMVNNEVANRQENRNIPGDGKFDATVLPSDVELEIGRIDFSKLPAFSKSEEELLKQYLDKNHMWRRGMVDYPRNAIIENNFASFDEGFGQNGWRNFVPMFGEDSVAVGNYDVQLVNDKHLFSYACGGGSYTSCGGIGTTQNLWAAKSILSIFTMNFGSYFGDWDSQNNFLRSALGSGDILANMWAGRPNWFLTSMASGSHLGYCAKLTQNANNSFFFTGNGGRFTHVALMGDPTLRLHSVKSVININAVEDNGSVLIQWEKGDQNQEKFAIYRVEDNGEITFLEEVLNDVQWIGHCQMAGKPLTFMVKPVVLEKTGSGSYYNSGIGEKVNLTLEKSNIPESKFDEMMNYETVTFQNLSKNADEFSWSFGDGILSNEASPVHTYKSSGTYHVCLTAENKVCPEVTQCATINIESSLPSSIMANLTAPKCHGEANGKISLETIGGNENEWTYLWSNGASTKNIENIIAGEYVLTITSNITGESRTSNPFILTQPDELIVNVQTTPSTGEDGTAVLLINGGTAPYMILWSIPNLDWNKLKPGNYSVTVTDANQCVDIVNFFIDMSTSIKDVSAAVQIYPNPVVDKLNITNSEKYVQIYVVDVFGKVVLKNEINKATYFVVNCSELPSGAYIVLLNTKSGGWSKSTIIIQR
ncbi:MAG: T9SS type A sorting domain-containing protein [Saprospiraceae bacterium]